MIYVDNLNREIEKRHEAKMRKRLKQNIPEGLIAEGTHKLARFFPECREKISWE